MPLDTRLPLMAGAQAPIQFQPESQLQTLSRIAPAVNAMRQMQAGQLEAAEAQRKQRAFQEFQTEVSRAFPGGVKELAQVFLTRGTMPQHFEVGQKLMEAAMRQEENQRLFGGGGGAAVGMPAPAAPAAPTMAQMPVSEVAPEMALGAAGGAQPRNAMMAMEMPAPAARPAAAAPTNMLEYGGSFYSPTQVQGLLASTNPQNQQLGRAIAEANRPQRAGAPSEISRYMAEMDALPPNDPRRKVLQARIDMLTTRQEPVRVEVNQQLERKESQEKGALNVAQFKDIATAATVAARTLPALETQERVLNAGFQTGFGTDAKKVGASILSALGVPEAERFASSAETFVSAMNQAVLQRQLEQKGPQTESDAQRITATGAQLGNTVQGNRFIIAVAKAQLKRDIAQRRFWEEYWRKNKTYEGAEEAWQSGAGGKSLFDAPELREFVRATTPPVAPQTGGAGAARPSGAGVDRNNPLLR